MLPRDLSLAPGDFIFFDAPDKFIHGGIIQGPASSAGTFPVHDCLGGDTQTRKYTPLYAYPGKADHVPHVKPPKNSSACPVILQVRQEEIYISGSISKSFFIDHNLLEYVESLGTAMPIMMPMMIADEAPSASFRRSAEVTTLRALLHAACLSPFGPLHALRSRVAVNILGCPVSQYVYNADRFRALIADLNADSVPPVSIAPSRCTSIMTTRMTARIAADSAKQSLSSPPSYDNSTSGAPDPRWRTYEAELYSLTQDMSSPSFRYYDLDNAFDSAHLAAPNLQLRLTTLADGFSVHMILNLVAAILCLFYAIYTTYNADYLYPHD
jgi:hypothetical protein